SIDDRGEALLQLPGRRLRAKAKIEVHHTLGGNDVAGSCTGVNVAHLPRGRREEIVPLVPFNSDKFGKRRSEHVNGIFRKVRIRDVTLYSFHDEFSAHRAAAAILDRVTRSGGGRRFADDAPVRTLASGG